MCAKYFSKQFVYKTVQDGTRMYISYRWQTPYCEGQTAQLTNCSSGGQTLVEQFEKIWAVSYPPWLSIMFQCRLNVALCVSHVSGMKYLFTYVCNGNDCVTVRMVSGQQYYDKTSQFQVRDMFLLWKRCGDLFNSQSLTNSFLPCDRMYTSRSITLLTSLKGDRFKLQTDLSPERSWRSGLLQSNNSLVPSTSRSFRVILLGTKAVSFGHRAKFRLQQN